MKSESVVIADQHAAVNTFSGLVHTARQANKVGGGRRAPQGELSRIQRWGLSRKIVATYDRKDIVKFNCIGEPFILIYNQDMGIPREP